MFLNFILGNIKFNFVHTVVYNETLLNNYNIIGSYILYT